jgi:tetratricopeptide (TPR) repeat protein
MTDRNQPDSTLNGSSKQFTSLSLANHLAFFLLFSSLALALSEIALGRTLGKSAQLSSQAPRNADAKADDEKEARLLESGKPIKRELAGDRSHTYQIRLSAGQFLKVIVEQQGIDVVIRLSGPGGEQIAEFDGDGRSQGQELVSLVAEADGVYLLMAQPRRKDAPPGGYEIRIEELRAATENDRALHEARKLLQEATKLREAGKYDVAIPLVERGREILARVLGPEHFDLADALNILARLYSNKAEYAKAEPFFQRALSIREKALGPEHPLVAAVIYNLGVLYSDTGAYAKAEEFLQRALLSREKTLGPDHPDIADSVNSIAILHFYKGDYAESERFFQRVISIREKALGPEHPLVAMALNNLGILYDETSAYAKAEEFYQRSLAIGEKTLGPDHLDNANTLNNLAELYFQKGAFEKAERMHQRARAIREKALGPDHPVVAVSLYNLARLFLELGDYAKAEPLLRRTLAIREKALGPDHPDIADTLNYLAEVYFQRGALENAERLIQRARAILEKAFGPDHQAVALYLTNLAVLYSERGDYAKAEPLFQQALAIFGKALGSENRNVVNTMNDLAVLYRNKGEYAKAEPLLKKALAILEKMLGSEHRDVVGFLDNLARLYAAKGDFTQAITVQARSNSITERNLALNLGAGSERQKLAYLALFSKQTDFTLTLHSQAAPHDAQALDLAFTTLLRRKGRGLDAMTDTIVTLRRHATPGDQTFFDQLLEARTQLAAVTLKGPGPDEPETYRARLKSLEDKVEELEATLSARSADFRAQMQPVTLTAVQASLPVDSALIEFAVYTPQDPRNDKNKPPQRYLAYLLEAQGRPKWIDLGETAPIDRAITSWQQALRDPSRTDVKRLARAVDEKVMRPMLALTQPGGRATHRLLIAPDGMLNLVPFTTLVDRQGRYLVERYSISYLTSGRDLLRLRASPPSKNAPLIMANPIFGRVETIGAQARQNSGNLQVDSQVWGQIDPTEIFFQSLPGAEREALAIKALLPEASVLLREQATETALKQSRAPRVLHIATHGFFLNDEAAPPAKIRGGADDNPLRLSIQLSKRAAKIDNPLLRSGLALAGANEHRSGDDDGVLTSLETASLDLWGTRLVVLSGCATGVGEVKNGEGVFGLRRALVLAGSETQVMSLWPVWDEETGSLMASYYRRLLKGEGRGEALRQVQLEMLKDAKLRHPHYWGNFIQSGEWANLDGQR